LYMVDKASLHHPEQLRRLILAVRGIKRLAVQTTLSAFSGRIVSVLFTCSIFPSLSLQSLTHLHLTLSTIIMHFNMEFLLLLGLVSLTAAAPTAPGALEARMGKKKNVPDSVTCKGTVLERGEIGGALSEAKQHTCLDATTGAYPHKFLNESGGKAIFGATSDLCEYPILKGSTYTGGKFPIEI
jgi:hypothetical protein